MDLKQQKTRIDAITANGVEPGLYRAAGAGVLLAVGSVLLDMGLSFAGGDVAVGSLDSVGWFGFFQANPLIGLRNLGLLNVINTLLMLPVYLVLYRLHRNGAQGFAALALMLYLLGTAVYISNNQALGMLALSDQYAAAATEAQREILASAGTVLLAQGEDFTPGTFMGFFLNNLAPLMMMVVLLRGNIFPRRVGILGLIGMACMLVFTVTVTFAPETLNQAMVLAMGGGLLMLAWDIFIAKYMFQLGRNAVRPESQSSLPNPVKIVEPGR